MDFRLIADNSSDLISVFDEKLKCVYVNHAMEKAIGICAQDLVDKTLHETGIPAHACNFLEKQIQQAFLIQDDIKIEIQMELCTKNGSKKWLWHSVPLKSSDNNILNVLLIGKDISDPKKDFSNYFVTEDCLNLNGTYEMHDICEIVEKEKVIRILEAVSLAASKFLQVDLSSENFIEILERLGKATHVSRVYIFQNEVEEDGTLLMSHKYEWVAPGIEPQIDNPFLQKLPYNAVAPRWKNLMEKRHYIAGLIKNFPPEEREPLAEQAIVSLAAVPIYVGKEWWGFIGFDECKRERIWSQVEMDALWIAADTIGAAILKQQIESQNRKSQKRLETVMEAVQTGVIIIDSDSHNIVDVNQVAIQLIGRKKDEIIGKLCYEFICPAKKGRCSLTDMKQIIDSSEHVLMTAKGEKIPILKKAVCVELDGMQRIVESFFDISNIKETERALMESEEKFKTLFMNANDAIYIYDYTQNKIMEVNTMASEMLGYTRDELLNKSPVELTLLEYASMLPERLKELQNKGSAIYETIYVDSAGNNIPVEVSCRIIDYKGKKAVLTVARDITERKMAEEVHKKEMLLKEIHHRVKNNLQVISSLLNLQARNFQDKKIRQAFAESQNRVRSMAIAHEKLYMSKDLENIDAADYIKKLADFLFHSYRVGTEKLSLEIDVEEMYLGIDTIIPMGLIVNELITNSLKYAFKPGENGLIKLSLKSNGNLLVLTISDNGKGIPENIDVFNAESLGMQIVVTLTEQLKGKLEFSRNDGTTFSIRFMKPCRN
jgi:PAS domain S-box-containing protein